MVLNQDYFTARDEDLKKIRSVMTVVAGRIVHDAGAIASTRAQANIDGAAAPA